MRNVCLRVCTEICVVFIMSRSVWLEGRCYLLLEKNELVLLMESALGSSLRYQSSLICYST